MMDTARAAATPVVAMQNLMYRWPNADRPVLNIPHWQVLPGESWCIYGDSGSGKSTLLNVLSGLLLPGSGQAQVLGQNLAQLTAAQRDRLRADHMGVIFQQFNLLPYLTVIDNVLLPVQLSARRLEKSQQAFASVQQEAEHWLQALDIPLSLWHQSVLKLSIGQQQRVAAARALMGSPELVIADEPTSALDARNANRFIQALKRVCHENNTTLVLVSHDLSLRDQFDHHWAMNPEALL